MTIAISLPLLKSQSLTHQHYRAYCAAEAYHSTRMVPVNVVSYRNDAGGYRIDVDSPLMWLNYIDELYLYTDFGITPEMREHIRVALDLNKWVRFRRLGVG